LALAPVTRRFEAELRYVTALDSQIDELYQQPLDEFTAARNTLAKTVEGADASRVRTLPKPTLVPWAVNQLYWRDRSVFDRLRKAGERLRAAQIAALKGRSADVHGAADAHRQAIAEASRHTLQLAQKAGSRLNADEITRTLEALSLAPELPEPPGRLTRPLQPAGFEALAGVTPAAIPARASPRAGADEGEKRVARAAHQSEADVRRAEAEARRAEADVKRAEAALGRATAAESRARLVWERTKREVEDAEGALAHARATLEMKGPKDEGRR